MDVNFGNTPWLFALAALPVIATLYLFAEKRSAEQLRHFVAPRLLTQLAGTVNRPRRALRFALQLFTLACAITALAKPRWGYTYEDVKRRGLDLLFAVDTSRSMLSNDVSPNRLARVKLAAQDLLTQLEGDRVGLIAFAGRAFLQAPLTIDYDAALEAINDLDTSTIPEGGTNISDAIALATKTLGKSAQGNRALVVFTDGEELSGDALNAAKTAAENGMRIFTIGVGTPQGSLIPVPGEQGGFVKDAGGQVVKSKLDEGRLRQIAQETGGIYLHLESGPATMKQLYETGLEKMNAGEFDARLSRRPIERYEWPLGAAILSLITSIFLSDRRRRVTARKVGSRLVPAAALVLFSTQLRAASPGIDAYQQQKYDDALNQFQGVLQQHPNNPAIDKLEFDSGAAAYKLKNYDKALQSFSQSLLSPDRNLQGKGHYNLGNTLYRRGEAKKSDEDKLTDWNGALKHYEDALKLEPANQQAKENYEFVKEKIEELKKKKDQPPPSPTPPQSQPNDSKQKKNDQDKDQQNKDQQKKDQQNKDQSQQQDQKDQQQQSGNDQQQQQNQQKKDNSSSPKQDQNSGDQKKNQPSPKPSQSEPNKQGEKPGQTPTPSPSPSGSPSPGSSEASPSPSASRSGSPSPTDSASPGESSSPTPTATPADGEGEATPAPSAKPKSGEIKSQGQEGDGEKKEQEAAALEEAEAEKRGEMSPQQAARLLRAMKDEEARVQLDERRAGRRVYKDW